MAPVSRSTVEKGGSVTETQLQAEILRALGSRPDVRLFRNQVGQGWVGRYGGRVGEGIVLIGARKVSFGLPVGSADLIGWRIITVSPEIVGRQIAQFLSVEVKTEKGAVRPEQRNWHDQVIQAGGLAMITRSVANAEAWL